MNSLYKKSLTITMCILLLFTTINVYAAFNYNVDESKIMKISNYQVKYANGIKLLTKANIDTIQKGIDFTSTIKINNGILNGKIIVQDSEKFILQGKLNKDKLNFEGRVLNKKGFTFEAFTLENGALLINIFDENNKPSTYLLNGIKSKIIPRNSMRVAAYYEDIISGEVDGIHYKLQGPTDPTGDPLWSLSFRTDVEDAWSDSGLGGYMRYGAYVQNARFGIKTKDNKSVYNFIEPSDTGIESFKFPVLVYIPPIGWQTLNIPVTTSSTIISGAGDEHVYVDLSWTDFTGYLHEYTEQYDEDKNGFGVKIEQHRNGSGPWTNSAYITMNYKLMAKKSEFSSPIYAYPAYQVEESLLTWTVN